MGSRADQFGQKNYRDGAIQRMGEATILLRAEQFSGAIYLAGRAAEGILRALIWKHDASIRQGKATLDTGHDLRKLLGRVRALGLFSGYATAQELDYNVQHVARLWYNNMRFASSRYVEAWWRELAEVHKRRTMKQAAKRYFDACSIIVRHCEVLCEK